MRCIGKKGLAHAPMLRFKNLAVFDADLLEGVACVDYKLSMFFHELVIDICVVGHNQHRVKAFDKV